MPDQPTLSPEIVESLDRQGMTLVASASQTGGAFELVEDVRAAGRGAIPHVHNGREEAFYVLEGRFTFVRGRDEIPASAGSFVFIPRGTRHGYRSEQDGSRLLFIVVPPGLSGFLREQGKRMAAGMSVLEAMTELSAFYDSHPVD